MEIEHKNTRPLVGKKKDHAKKAANRKAAAKALKAREKMIKMFGDVKDV